MGPFKSLDGLDCFYAHDSAFDERPTVIPWAASNAKLCSSIVVVLGGSGSLGCWGKRSGDGCEI